MSSGQRINRASDDAAGLSISSSLDLSARVFSVSKRNVSDVISALSIAYAATDALQAITERQRELATQASSGTFSSKQREALDAEAQQLTNEYNRVILTTEFNGRKLFEDPFETMTAQVGIGEGGTIGYELASELATPMAGGSYFILDGEENTYVWFTMDGKGSDPRPFGTTYAIGYPSSGIQVDLVSTPGGGTLDPSVTLEFGPGSEFTSSGRADLMKVQVGLTSANLWFNVDGSNTNLEGGNIQVAISASWSAAQVRDAVVSALNSQAPGVFALTLQGEDQLVLKEQLFTDVGASAEDIGSLGGVRVVNVIDGGPVRGPTAAEVAQSVTDAINSLGYAWTASLGSSEGEVLVDSLTSGGSNSTGDVSTGILATEILSAGDGRRDYALIANTWDFAGTARTNMALADLNNDGFDDLIQTNRGYYNRPDELSVFLNQGDGTFGARSAYSAFSASSIRSVPQTADLNGDGFLDLVEANGSRVSVYLNQGDGTFGARADLSLGNTRQGPSALADVNGDGRIDILQAYGTTTSSRVGVFINQGDGSFADALNYTLPSTPTGGVSVADLNEDGFADFLAPISPSNTVAVALNDGFGNFGARATYAVGATPSSATSLADLNGDGRPDIVQTNTGAASGAAESVSVLLNLGSGTFAAQSTYAVGDNPRGSATLADVNGDGAADIVQSNHGSGTVSVLLNDGSGVFGTRSDYAVGTNPIGSTTVNDVNGDGHADLVQSNSDSTISILFNLGDGTFGTQTQYSSQNGLYSAHVADLDKDGLNDILRAGSGQYFTTLANQGAGSFDSSTLSAKLTFSDARGTAKIQHVDLTTAASAREAMDTLEARAEKISRQRAVYGSVESRLKAAASVIDSTVINYRSAESRIKDTDVAEDAASMMRLNILKQVGASVLAQANLEPQIALRLLQGA